MFSPQQRHDKLVRATDLDALSCRVNANRRGYFVPADRFVALLVEAYHRHLAQCPGYTALLASRTLKAAFAPKLPLINRGTYFRTKAIDMVLERFVAQHAACQVVLLGSGSDTRAFRTLERHRNVVYHEIDFGDSTAIKAAAIGASAELRHLVGAGEFAALARAIHTDRYHLHGFDLRRLPDDGGGFGVDASLPTLIISECALCYLTPEENLRVLQYWRAQLTGTLGLLVYEPMSLNDAFGRTMVANLGGRGITLPMFDELPTLELRQRYFAQLGFDQIRATDLSVVSGYERGGAWVDDAEFRRINLLELIDEVEEIRLLLRHYCLVYAGVGDEVRWPPQ